MPEKIHPIDVYTLLIEQRGKHSYVLSYERPELIEIDGVMYEQTTKAPLRHPFPEKLKQVYTSAEIDKYSSRKSM